MNNSFYPAARKVFLHPVVRWAGATIAGLLISSFTIGIWPLFKGWMLTRADTDSVEKIAKRTSDLEAVHKSELSVSKADSDDAGSLTHGQQVEWLIVRVKRLEMREVELAKRNACLEAKLRMPKPHADAAKAACTAVEKEFTECIKNGNKATEAISCSLKAVFGSD